MALTDSPHHPQWMDLSTDPGPPLGGTSPAAKARHRTPHRAATNGRSTGAEKASHDAPARRRDDNSGVRGGIDRRRCLRRHSLQGRHERPLTGMNPRRDGGMATAELAVVLPTLVLVIAAGLTMVSVVLAQVRC